jgi:hypothetical protein
MTRPSEAISGIAASVLGAVLIVGGAFFDVSKFTPEVVGAIVLLVGWVGTAVTAVIAAKQRNGQLPSASDGAVK